MGQYYKGIILDKNYKKVDNPVLFGVTTWTFDGGAKLMEHSWVGNTYVNIYMRLLAGQYYDSRVVWGGDYAEERFSGNRTAYQLINEENEKEFLKQVEGCKAWGTCYGGNPSYRIEGEFPNYKYLINFTKRKYVEIPAYDPNDDDTWYVHPLPLLCADGNGGGGGDYFSPCNKDLVGKWAYDRIGVGNEIPEGFTLLKYDKVDDNEKVIFKVDW